MKKVKRQIYFYEVNLQRFNDKEKGYKNVSDFKIELCNIFKKIDILHKDKNDIKNSIYNQKQNGSYDFVIIDSISDQFIEGKLVNTDDSGLTYFEENGEIKPLKDVIENDGSVAEVSHFVFFLKTRLLAFEYNAKCSHAASLANYLNNKFQPEYTTRFLNLMNSNKKKRINSLCSVKRFSFEVSNKVENVRKANNGEIFTAINSVKKLLDEDTDAEQIFTISMRTKRVGKKNKKPYSSAEKTKENIEDLISACNEDEKLFKLDVVGYNELNEQIAINYTNDFVTKTIKIDENKTESKFFYEQIKEVYNKVYNEYYN